MACRVKRLNPNKIKTLLTPLALKENFTLVPGSIRLHIDHNKNYNKRLAKPKFNIISSAQDDVSWALEKQNVIYIIKNLYFYTYNFSKSHRI